MAESRARTLANLANTNALSVDGSSLDVGISSTSPDSDLNVGASIKMDGPSGIITATSFSGDGSALTGIANTAVIAATQLTVTGVVTAASFTGDGANLTNVGVDTATVNTGALKVSGVSTLTGVVNAGSDVRISGNLNAGIVTVTSISGDGSALTGIAATDTIAAASLTVSGITTLSNTQLGIGNSLNFANTQKAFIQEHSVGVGSTTTAGRNAGLGTAIGALVYNITLGQLEVYTGTRWRAVEGKTTVSGGTETTSGVYTIHTFTSSGSLVVAGKELTADYLVVAGGGGGGGTRAGGGGAGGMIESPDQTIPVGTHTVTIGAGGNGGPGVNSGAVGENSSLGSLATANGGAYGGGQGNPGGPGGSGGGGSDGAGGGEGTPGQGNDGGNSSGDRGGGGGGGKDGAGGYGPTGTGEGDGAGGAGGAAGSSTYSGATVNYSGGGGGGSRDNGTPGNGGGGGAGAGGRNPTTPAGNASVNQGGGGGGGGRHPTGATLNGGNGGSGIVIVRYQTDSL